MGGKEGEKSVTGREERLRRMGASERASKRRRGRGAGRED